MTHADFTETVSHTFENAETAIVVESEEGYIRISHTHQYQPEAEALQVLLITKREALLVLQALETVLR